MNNRIGQQFGHYQLVQLLGQGGFADVYLGVHIHLQTPAAVKIMHNRLTEEEVAQFRTEAQNLANLRHPHIVRILDFGLEETIPFLVMDYAPNGTLRKKHPPGSRLSLTTVISYVRQMASALSFAHEHRLIHCDVKPENMLLGSNGELLLSDFGIAAVAHSTTTQKTQEIAGTVAYMAPEQLQGRPRVESDQYALGIVVYEWLCGKRPFQGNYIQIATQHQSIPPPPLRDTVPSLPPAFERVVMRALEKDPKKRFAGIESFTAAMAAAVPAATSPAAAAAGSTLLAYRDHFGGANVVAWSPDGSRIATSGDDRTVQIWNPRTDATLLTYEGHCPPPTSREMLAASSSNHHRPFAIAVAWSPDGKCIASGSWDTIHVWDATTGADIQAYHGHRGQIAVIAWSPDGTLIASGGRDEVQVWDPTTGSSLHEPVTHHHYVKCLSWSPDSKRIASTDTGAKVVIVWEARTGEVVFKRGCTPHRAYQSGLVLWSPDGRLIASGNQHTLEIWDAATLAPVLYCGQSPSRERAAWSPDSSRFALVGHRDVEVWHIGTANRTCTYAGHSSPVQSVTWSPDGNTIASASAGEVSLWNAATGETLCVYHPHRSFADSLAWSPDGGRLVSGSSESGWVHVWDARTGTTLASCLGYHAAWSPDGTRMAVVSPRADQVQVRDADTWEIISTYRGHAGGYPDGVYALDWSPDSQYLVSTSIENNQAHIWDANTGACVSMFSSQAGKTPFVQFGRIRSIAWSPDGQRIVFSAEQTVQVWDARTCVVREVYNFSDWVQAVAWSPDGTCIASGTEDEVQVRGALVSTFPITRGVIGGPAGLLCWSPDGTALACVDDAGIQIWYATSQQAFLLSSTHATMVTALAWSPNSKYIAFTSNAPAHGEATVQVWEARGQRPVFIYTAHGSKVTSLAWSPDGRLIASASTDGSIHAWQTAARWFS